MAPLFIFAERQFAEGQIAEKPIHRCIHGSSFGEPFFGESGGHLLYIYRKMSRKNLNKLPSFSMSMSNFLANFEQIMSAAYSVSVLMDFSAPQQVYQVWLTSKLGDENYKNFSGACAVNLMANFLWKLNEDTCS